MRRIGHLLGIIPSIGIVPGGAVPIFFFINSIIGGYRYPKVAFYSLFCASVFLLLFVTRLVDILDYLYFLIGPLFFISYLNINFEKYKLYPLIYILIFDSFLGYIVSMSNDRSLTFIGNEPSHIARYFFVIILLASLNRSRYVWLASLSVIYVFFNQSFTSLLFLVYVCYFIYKRLRIKTKLMLLVGGAMVLSMLMYFNPEMRFINQVKAISSVEYSAILGKDNLGVLTTLGSRRLTQSYIGYSLSQPYQGVGIGKGDDNFRKDAIDKYPELKKVSNIYRRSNVEPTSYLSQLSYEIGYYNSVLFLIILLLPLILSRGYEIRSQVHLFFGLFQLLFFSTNVFVIPWFFLALGFNKKFRNG